MNPGIARKVFGKVDPKNPKTLIVDTHEIDYKRQITVYVPAQHKADAAAPDGTPVEISALTLASVVEQLIAADPNAPKFSFVAPSAALQHIKSYMGGGVYMRSVEAAQ